MGAFNGLVLYISLVWADTHSMVLGRALSCFISIFAFLRFLTIYQVTATILFSSIPLLAVVRYGSIACAGPITFWFIDFSSLCCCFSTKHIFFLLIVLQECPLHFFHIHCFFSLWNICICKKVASYIRTLSWITGSVLLHHEHSFPSQNSSSGRQSWYKW